MIRRLTITLIVIVATVATLPAAAQLYHAGEVLRYKVSYIAKMVPNIEMAKVDVQTSLEETEDGKPVYMVYGVGRVNSGYRWIYNLEDRYWIWVDTVSLRTLRFRSDLREGKSYTFKSHFDFDYRQMKAYTWAQRRSDKPIERTVNLTPHSMDAVSLYFNLRSVDTDSFSEGQTRQLDMVLEDTVRYLKYRFLGREVKKVPGGKSFATLKFSCQIGTTESFSFTDGSEFTIWISDDGNKIPVMLESPIRVGRVRAYLYEWRGLRYPFAAYRDR